MTSSNYDDGHSRPCFLHRISEQQTDLKELLDVLNEGVPNGDVELLRRLACKNIQHLNEYQQSRSSHNGGDALSTYSPSWCTTLENSLSWIGGLKVSAYIRLVYSISEIESEESKSKVSKLFNEGGKECGIYMSEMQLRLIKALHADTVSSEDRISSRMANLQECIMIEPLVNIAVNKASKHEVGQVVATHRQALGSIMGDADELRVMVLKELIQILTPLQGIHFWVALNRLHLSIHHWGKDVKRSTT